MIHSVEILNRLIDAVYEAGKGEESGAVSTQAVAVNSVLRERVDQIIAGCDAEYDDTHSIATFAVFISERLWRAVYYMADTDEDPTQARVLLVQVAALALAAVESMDRYLDNDKEQGEVAGTALSIADRLRERLSEATEAISDAANELLEKFDTLVEVAIDAAANAEEAIVLLERKEAASISSPQTCTECGLDNQCVCDRPESEPDPGFVDIRPSNEEVDRFAATTRIRSQIDSMIHTDVAFERAVNDGILQAAREYARRLRLGYEPDPEREMTGPSGELIAHSASYYQINYGNHIWDAALALAKEVVSSSGND